jgi:hypothetical protein
VLVYDGLITKNIWVEKPLPGGAKLTSAARIWWDSKFGTARKMFLHEFQFNQLMNISVISSGTNNLLGD